MSVPTNIVEGSARESLKDYQYFLRIAFGSSKEVEYLLGLSNKLGYLSEKEFKDLGDHCENLVRALNGLLTSLKKVSR